MSRDRASRRVLFVVNSVDDAAGGTVRAVVNTAEALAEAGCHVTVAGPTTRGQDHLTVGAVGAGVRVLRFPGPAPVVRTGTSPRLARWLVRHVADFDEVHVHSVFHAGLPLVAGTCLAAGVPYLVWPHGCLDPFDLRKHARVKSVLGPLLLRPVLRGARALVCTSSRERDALVTWGSRSEVRVVALPVAPLEVRDGDGALWRARHGVPVDVPLVLFLGRLSYKKGLPLLLEAMALLERPWRLAVVGSGSDVEVASLDDALLEHRVADRVVRTGWLEGADRVGAFAAADVFVLLSDNENFGLAVAEAASVGCPVVVSDQVHVGDELAAVGGAVVVPRDAAAAAAAVRGLLDDPDRARAMGLAGAALVRELLAPAAVGARLSAGLR